MSLTPNEMELHRRLIAAFNDYIVHNLKWEEYGHTQTASKLRKKLRLIIDLAYLRSKEVLYARKGEEQEPVLGKEFFRELVRKHGSSERSFENQKTQREQRKQAALKRTYTDQTNALARYREQVKKGERKSNKKAASTLPTDDNSTPETPVSDGAQQIK